jgi:hypothetical protein
MAAINLSSLKNEAASVVNEATNLADLADKWADRIRPLLVAVPGVGTEAATVVSVLDELDKALHEAKNILADL